MAELQTAHALDPSNPAIIMIIIKPSPGFGWADQPATGLDVSTDASVPKLPPMCQAGRHDALRVESS
jgi:hypothetical protein